MSGAPDGAGSAPDTSIQGDHGAAPADNTPGFDVDFVDMFRHDPFSNNQGEPKPPAAPAAQPTGAAPAASPVAPVAPAAAPTAAPAPGTGAAPTAPVVPPVVDPNAALMRDTAAALAAATNNLNSRPDPSAPPAADPTMNYSFNVPPQLAAALVSEDPNIRVNALAHMQAAITQEAHRRIRAEMTTYAETQVPQMIQSMLRAHTFRQEVNTDFYGKYPQLKAPGLAQLVAGISAEVLNAERATNPNVTWNDKVRDAIAERVFLMIPQLRTPAAAVPVTPQRPNTPPAGQTPPPRVFNGGTRPAAGGDAVQDDIMNTLFG